MPWVNLYVRVEELSNRLTNQPTGSNGAVRQSRYKAPASYLQLYLGTLRDL